MSIRTHNLLMMMFAYSIPIGIFGLTYMGMNLGVNYVFYGTLWMFLCIIFGVPIISLAWSSYGIQKQGVFATATITGFVKTVDHDGDESYYPCFELDVQGKVYSVQNRVTYQQVKYQTGDEVNIHYLPDDPQQAEIDDKKAGVLFVVLSGIFILGFIIGVLHFVFRADGIGELYSKVCDLLK